MTVLDTIQSGASAVTVSDVALGFSGVAFLWFAKAFSKMHTIMDKYFNGGEDSVPKRMEKIETIFQNTASLVQRHEGELHIIKYGTVQPPVSEVPQKKTRKRRGQ